MQACGTFMSSVLQTVQYHFSCQRSGCASKNVKGSVQQKTFAALKSNEEKNFYVW